MKQKLSLILQLLLMWPLLLLQCTACTAACVFITIWAVAASQGTAAAVAATAAPPTKAESVSLIHCCHLTLLC